MTWVDGLLLIVMALLAYGGVRRGIVLEMFDWIAFILGGTVAYWGYHWLGGVISFIPWQRPALDAIAFMLVFIPLGAGAIMLGLVVDRPIRSRIPKTINEIVGALIGFFKSFVAAWLLLLLLSALPFTHEFREEMKTAPVVQLTEENVTPFMVGMLDTFTSREVAREQRAAIARLRF